MTAVMADPVGDAAHTRLRLIDWAARLEQLARDLRAAVEQRDRDDRQRDDRDRR